MPLFRGKSKILSNDALERSQQDVRRYLQSEQALLARRGLDSPSGMRFGNFRAALFPSGAAELTAPALCKLRLDAWQRYLDSIGAPMIWASRAATAER